MAIHTTITSLSPFEAPRETAVSEAFVDLLQGQAAFVRAELELEDVAHSQDPAYAFWLSDAETAQERLTKSLHQIQALTAEVPEDRPLKRMAMLIDAMLGQEEPGGARRLHREMQLRYFSHLQARGIGAVAMHRNALLIQARHLTTAMINLPLFDSTEVDDGGSDPAMQPLF